MEKVDIIGDVHGHVEKLQYVLEYLGYYKSLGVYKHRERQALFIGDYIDKGTDPKESVRVIRDMVLANQAIALIGNHEFNFLCYNKKDKLGNYLRAHTDKNESQVKDTLASYKGHEDRLAEDLDWFQTLPLFYESDGFRAIHAAWIQEDVDFVLKMYPNNNLSDDLLYKASNETTQEYAVIEKLLKGPEITLPAGLTFRDNSGFERNQLRVKWWEDLSGKTLYDMAARSETFLPKTKFEESLNFSTYGHLEKPVFFGHYCLPTKLSLLKPNVCCVDYCVYKTNRIVAYRWDGEHELIESKMVNI